MTNNSGLSDLLQSVTKVEKGARQAKAAADKAQVEASATEKKDIHTRSNLTMIFLCGFFGVMILSAVFVWCYNRSVVDWAMELSKLSAGGNIKPPPFLELDKVLSIVISALGTSLGFIIGYYFKDKNSSG
ncbi:hypothetical protein MMS95_13145 [Serratia sp. PGPR-27]|uniref:hypothetical protein n=1 Tax=Serratia TaxID=613 RepID=UPI001071B44F|nr:MULTISPECIES: hypothetical protein [Serratia]MCI2403758.1 hypothetical protein [Serratia sp. PGPR-27]HAT5009352.1 hypothetical protein [Serratia marcescens]